jgi:Zn-finger nucleic acid-binding protein
VTYRDRPIRCPRCGVDLARHDIRDVWSCSSCKGVLSSVEELTLQLVTIAPELVPEDRAGVRGVTTISRRAREPLLGCAVCGTAMDPVFLGGVEVDRCRGDEMVWFDVGEEERVLESARVQHARLEESWLRRTLASWFGDRW